jgi:tetratricopeptide (TPR) repeat protein
VNFITQLFGKNSSFPAEYKRFKKAMERNSRDYGLKAQFIKFCLLNRFTKQETMENHIAEVLALFETIDPQESFDLQCHYLVGKYYQENKDFRKAYQVYLNAITLFNQYVSKNPNLKSENAELAYSIALNLLNLQSNPVDPEVEKCFKNIRKSYPLHLKRIELENEMAKPAPDKERVKQLTEEIHRLKSEEDEETPVPAEEEPVKPSLSKPAEKDDIFAKLFRVPAPDSQKLAEWVGMEIQKQKKMSETGEKTESLKFSLLSEFSSQGPAFMVFQNNDWQGPYSLSQLRSMGYLNPATWVCRVGSQLVTQAYEVPDLMSLLQ